jgi:2-pyrone-4,6-dicarboxylate lactonase
VHVFGPQALFPFNPDRQVTPKDAPKEALFALHESLGIERCVIVQSAVHGQDNRVLEDAMRARPGTYLGVALLPTQVADAELTRLASLGVRGVRFNFMAHLGRNAQGIEEIIAFTHRLKRVGMHLQVHFESHLIHDLSDPLRKSAVPVVIDHMGRVDAELGVDHPDVVELMQLLRSPQFYVKVSGIDRVDSRFPFKDASHPYHEGIQLAKLLLQTYPHQCVWGTDWPHPNHTHIPDDGVLVQALGEIAPSEELLHHLLVSTPQNLYNFSV